jgi:lantibiotic modifying enzyme
MPSHSDVPNNIGRRDALQRTAAMALATMFPATRRAAHRGSTAPVRPYLDAAKRAAQWITQSQQSDARGAWWPVDPLKPADIQTNLYSGTAGIVLFYLELYDATRDHQYLVRATAGAEYLIATLPASPAALTGEAAGLYTGLAGIAYTLERTYAATRDEKYLAAAQRAMQSVHASELLSTGGGWNASNDIVSGTAGIGLTMLWASRALLDARATDAAARAGQQLLGAGQQQTTGIKWELQPGVTRRYPNFSHGTAGVSFFLASLAAQTGDPTLRDAAVGGALYLQSIAETTASGGHRVMHSEPGGEQLFYMSWCHGPAGTARLFHQLAVLTRQPAWSDYVDALARGIVDSGVPDVHPDTSGFWNNISQCCGNCGISEFFIAQHRRTRNPADLAFATRVVDNTLSRATSDGDGLKWVQAENRVQPDVQIAQTGLMQGAAGVGLALLHLDGAIRHRVPFITLPDSPSW